MTTAEDILRERLIEQATQGRAGSEGTSGPPLPGVAAAVRGAQIGAGLDPASAMAVPPSPPPEPGMMDGLGRAASDTATTMVRAPLSVFDLPNLAARGVDWSVRQMARRAGIPEGGIPFRYQDYLPPSGSQLASTILSGLGIPETQAQTSLGRILQGILGGVAGGATMGGITGALPGGAGAVPTAARGAIYGGMGGGSSETAGEVTAGTPYEMPARIAAGLAVPAMAALIESRIGAAPRSVGGMVREATDAQWQRAQELFDEAIARGQPLTVAEAAAEAQMPGAGRLLVAQRSAEQSARGGPTFDRFRANQAPAAQQAIEDLANRVAPAVDDPYAVGARAQGAASGVVREAERARTAAAGQAGYTAAEPQALPPQAIAPVIDRIRQIRDIARGGVAQTGALRAELTQLETQLLDEATRPNSTLTVGRIDELYKDFRTRLEGSGLPGADATLRAAATRLGPVIESIRSDVLQANPDYAAGARQFAADSPAVDRVAQGLPGRIAATDDPQRHLALITGPNARPGTVRGTLTEMQTAPAPISGNVDPQVVADLVRLRLENAQAGAAAYVGNLPRQQLGARFNALLRTNPQAAANFAAAIETLPGGRATLADMNRLLDIFQAQGRRLPVGSATDFNQAYRAEMSGSPVLTTLTAPTQIPGRIRSWADRMGYSQNMGQVADMFTSPQGIEQLRAAVNRPNAILRALLAADVDRALQERRRASQ